MPTLTLDTPEFCFLHVSLVYIADTASNVARDPLELLTWRHLIATALTREHGILGGSVHVDILHHKAATTLEPEKVIIRIPRTDQRMVWNAISGWSDARVGRAMRVLKVSDSLAALL